VFASWFNIAEFKILISLINQVNSVLIRMQAGLGRVPTHTDKKIQDFSGPPGKIFQDVFRDRECLNTKKKKRQ